MKFDVILILAGGINTDGTLPYGVLKRINMAKKLYDKKNASRIVMSGYWSNYWDHFPPQKTEAQLMSDYAVSLGIPRKNILLEEHSQNTFENFFYTTKLFLEPNDWKKVIIITSDYHFKRVQKTGNAFFDSDYQIKYIGAIEPAPKMKKMIRYIKETILLHTQGFFQNFFNRR